MEDTWVPLYCLGKHFGYGRKKTSEVAYGMLLEWWGLLLNTQNPFQVGPPAECDYRPLTTGPKTSYKKQKKATEITTGYVIHGLVHRLGFQYHYGELWESSNSWRYSSKLFCHMATTRGRSRPLSSVFSRGEFKGSYYGQKAKCSADTFPEKFVHLLITQGVNHL